MRHPGHGSLPPLPDGLQDEMLGGGRVVGANPVTRTHQQVLLLRGDILRAIFRNEKLRKLPANKKFAENGEIMETLSFRISYPAHSFVLQHVRESLTRQKTSGLVT